MTTAFQFARFDNGSAPDSITAVGTTQSGAAALTGAINYVTTSAGQVAAVLSANSSVGSPVIVLVSSATSATIFPPVGGKINGGSANAAFTVAQAKPAMFYAHTNGLDYTVVLSA